MDISALNNLEELPVKTEPEAGVLQDAAPGSSITGPLPTDAPAVSNGGEPVPKKPKTEARPAEIPTFSEPPVHEMVGGSSVRRFLNEHLTEHLLEGLKHVSKTKPENPLYELGTFLIERSKTVKSD